MIGPESNFRRLPADLVVEQALFFDGVRFAAQGVNFAFSELKRNLHRLVRLDRDEAELDHEVVAAVHFTWSIIDGVDRLRSLVIKGPLPFGKQKPAPVRRFLEATHEIRQLRNRVQHLEGFLKKLVKQRDPVWGKISWVLWEGQGEERSGYSCCLAAGGALPDKSAVVRFPMPIPADFETEEVALHAAGRVLRLDHTIAEVEGLIEWFEQFLEERFSQHGGSVPSVQDLRVITELDLAELQGLLGKDD